MTPLHERGVRTPVISGRPHDHGRCQPDGATVNGPAGKFTDWQQSSQPTTFSSSTDRPGTVIAAPAGWVTPGAAACSSSDVSTTTS